MNNYKLFSLNIKSNFFENIEKNDDRYSIEQFELEIDNLISNFFKENSLNLQFSFERLLYFSKNCPFEFVSNISKLNFFEIFLKFFKNEFIEIILNILINLTNNSIDFIFLLIKNKLFIQILNLIFINEKNFSDLITKLFNNLLNKNIFINSLIYSSGIFQNFLNLINLNNQEIYIPYTHLTIIQILYYFCIHSINNEDKNLIFI